MPWPISAGVFGMARTTRSVPVAATIASLRMPAITDSCSALPTCGATGRAASANDCGLTAQTTSAASASDGSAAASTRTPWSRDQLGARVGGGLHDQQRGRRAPGLDEPADDRAGHVAAADEGGE